MIFTTKLAVELIVKKPSEGLAQRTLDKYEAQAGRLSHAAERYDDCNSGT